MYLSIKIIIILLQQYLEKFWMHHQHSSKESLFPVALRQLLDIVYHCSEQNGASRPVMTPGPYFRWAFVVLCPMRVWNTEAAAVRQPRTFRAPCHPLGRAATRAWRRVPPPPHRRCQPSLVQSCDRGGRGTTGRTQNWGVREVCNTFAYQRVLRVRNEKTSDAEGKGKVRLWGVGGSRLGGDTELSSASFLKQVLSSSESWND